MKGRFMLKKLNMVQFIILFFVHFMSAASAWAVVSECQNLFDLDSHKVRVSPASNIDSNTASNIEMISESVNHLWQARDRAESLAAETLRSMAVDSNGYRFPTPEGYLALRNYGQMTLDLIHKQSKMIEEFLIVIVNENPNLASFVKHRLDALKNFSAGLPAEYSEVKLTGQNAWYNNRPESIGKYRAINEEMLEHWIRLQNNDVLLQDLIKSIRSVDQKILANPKVQNHLIEIIASGLEQSIFESKFSYILDKTSTSPEFYSAQYLFGSVLLLRFGAKFEVKFEVERGLSPLLSERLSFPTNSYDLTVPLLIEIIHNAFEAGIRRAGKEERAVPFYKLHPLVTVTNKVNGEILVSIEDKGDPSELASAVSIGHSTQNDDSRVGVGIGRLRIELISRFLGYRITHRPRPDGLGSIVEIRIPATPASA
jgi:hypothetical protein